MIKRSIILTLLVCLLAAKVHGQVLIGDTEVDTTTVVGGLDTPWEILWGPDNKIWLTERMGRISIADPETGKIDVILTIDEVHEQSESGLLGMVLHPGFEANGYVFLVYNYLSGNEIREKLVRYTWSGTTLTSPVVLLENIGGAGNHNGSRLAFDKDTMLYMTSGDAVNTSTSQDTSSLNGKILRMNPDGTVPPDNPFPGSHVWTIGHRNPQGLVFSPAGLLYSSEHGPANDDELNLISKSGNYGWPQVHGFCDQPTETSFCSSAMVVEPLAAWTPTLAVCGIDYYGGGPITTWENSLLMTSLKASRLTVMNLDETGTEIEKITDYFSGWWGRLRDVCVSPDGRVFIASSNRDGRGNVRPGDDRIVEIKPSSPTRTLQKMADRVYAFPNPVTGEILRLQNLPAGENRIRILNPAGRIVFDESFKGMNPVLEIPFKWKDGVYILSIQNGQGIINEIVVKLKI
jgi:glucose/arabinose dehydrogenase